jgi:Cu/Ag efflux protein CusF
MNNALLIAGIAFAALIAFPVLAQTATDHGSHHGGAAPKSAATTDGEVRKVDKRAGKVTIRHGEIRNLEMPAMTMVFTASNPKMLDGLKEGDKIKFTADNVNGVLTVTAVEVVK